MLPGVILGRRAMDVGLCRGRMRRPGAPSDYLSNPLNQAQADSHVLRFFPAHFLSLSLTTRLNIATVQNDTVLQQLLRLCCF